MIRQNPYEFRASISCGGRVPADLVIQANEDGYELSGGFEDKDVNQLTWNELPHVAFANLSLDDHEAVKGFVRTYGLLRLYKDFKLPRADGYQEPVDTDEHFTVNRGSLELAQTRLREAWEGSPSARVAIEGEVEEDVHAKIYPHADYCELSTESLLPFMYFLFLRDAAAEKLGRCANPDCRRYFIRERSSQKFCRLPACAAYATRNYSNKWYESRGSKHRKKLRKRSKKRK